MNYKQLLLLAALHFGCVTIYAMDDQRPTALAAAQRAIAANQERNPVQMMIDITNTIRPYINESDIPDLVAKLIDGDESVIRAFIKALNTKTLAEIIKPHDFEQLTSDLEELKSHYLKHGSFNPQIKAPALASYKPEDIDAYLTGLIQKQLVNRTPHQVNQIRGATAAVGGLITLWLMGHALMHAAMELMEPTYMAAGAWFIITAIVLYYAHDKISNRETYCRFMTNYIAPVIGSLDAKRAEALIAVPRGTATQAPADAVILAQPAPSNDPFWGTLSSTQWTFIPDDQRETYRANPRMVMANAALVVTLDLRQTEALSRLIFGS